MRLLFFVAFIVDAALGLLCIFFAHQVQIILNIAIREEPVFIRLLGLFPLFVGYLYYLLFRDQKKYLILIQVTVVERILYPILLSFEIFYLLKAPFSLIHYSFIGMALVTLFLGVMQIYYLKNLKEQEVLIR